MKHPKLTLHERLTRLRDISKSWGLRHALGEYVRDRLFGLSLRWYLYLREKGAKW